MVIYKPVVHLPPLSLLAHCRAPEFTATTWAELAADNARLAETIEACDRRVSALRAWRELVEDEAR